MLTHFISAAFGKSMIASVIVLFSVSSYLCYQNKSKEQQLITAGKELTLIKADNRQLANQLENAHIQIAQYQSQVKALHQNVLSKLQHAEERTNDILAELEKQQNWAKQPVPDRLSRLLKQRAGKHQQTQSADLPQRKSLPAAQSSSPQHQR
ncbi:hypothetical protein E4T80_00125 [Muribacter muris]|uniref:DUF2570 domain-containing protein n=1 Tax=Muribacter muris TaxID=67855 RepID=A0A4Y9K9L5_9PAST|nr:hypothetical protein [Muribacter muris]MBF0783888.1 hypothetical protein [Muribacter muris]MBF0826386.1 hypothetical protein [Muribacter muris]TFV13286.1 hypothetical protein E4T80_00125 [Muribacter muris]